MWRREHCEIVGRVSGKLSNSTSKASTPVSVTGGLLRQTGIELACMVCCLINRTAAMACVFACVNWCKPIWLIGSTKHSKVEGYSQGARLEGERGRGIVNEGKQRGWG